MNIIKQKKRGFTLIEILVVVLIIGILAAIALPQYERTVERSKASQALTLIKAIGESVESYNMATGHYPTSFNQLDISIPESFDIDEPFISNGVTYGKSNQDWNISIERYRDESYVGLYMMRKSGKYKGAGFYIRITAKNGKCYCNERKNSANYIFDSSLPDGAYCEKIIQGKYLSTSTYIRLYDLN